MTRPVHFVRGHWQAIVIGATGVLVAVTCVLAVWTALNGATTNRILSGQAETDAAAECRATYAAADRVASSNLDITKAEIISLFGQAAVIADTEPLADLFAQAKARNDTAIRERFEVAATQDSINANCSPGDGDPLVPAEPVAPIRPLEDTP